MIPEQNPKVMNLIKEYLEQARLMQVATSKDNQPWACSVYFVSDSSLKLYWISHPTRRHSEEIRANSKVAGTIVLPHTPGDKARGIQFQGIAQELEEKKEVEFAVNEYAKRYKLSQERIRNILENKDGHLCYCIEPTWFVLFDEVNFPDSPRQEYKL